MATDRYLTLEVTAPAALLALLIACLASIPLWDIPPPTGGNILDANLPMLSRGHLFGTDTNGNDIWSRLLYGGRTSLVIALAVNAFGLVVGSALGALGAYRGGILDALVMRTLDVFVAFPPLILVLAVAEALGPGTLHTIWALAFFSVPAFARIARASTLRLREQPFMLAAQFSGTRTWRTLSRHIAPNIFPQLATYALLGMGTVITIEGAVSFLGLGVAIPQPSWGNMIFQGQLTLLATPNLVLLPSAFLFVTVLCFNLLSEAARASWSAR